MRRRFGRDARGVSTMEFGLLSPVLFALLFGGLDVAHTIYMKALLVGELQKAARDTSLEGAADQTRINAIAQRVRDQVRSIMSTATVNVVPTSFRNYGNIGKMEEFTDSHLPLDGKCDFKETYVDSNNDGTWNVDNGTAGRGGAKDVVYLTATVSYDRLAFGRFFPWGGDRVQLQSSMLLRNQPSDQQAASPTRQCP